jgi:hypothetical protein
MHRGIGQCYFVLYRNGAAMTAAAGLIVCERTLASVFATVRRMDDTDPRAYRISPKHASKIVMPMHAYGIRKRHRSHRSAPTAKRFGDCKQMSIVALAEPGPIHSLVITLQFREKEFRSLV